MNFFHRIAKHKGLEVDFLHDVFNFSLLVPAPFI